MPISLEDRFKSFMKSVEFAESIDDLLVGKQYEGKRRADYLLFNRKVIVELKKLAEDTSSKVEQEIDKHRDRKDFPLIYGQTDLQKILKHLPDGENINRRIHRNLTRSVEKKIRSADEQFVDTKDIFNLDNSIGLLVVLNQDIEVFSPEVVLSRLGQHLCSSSPSSPRVENVDFVWFLSESHIGVVPNIPNAFPSILLTSQNSEHDKCFTPLFERLQHEWARFNGLPLVQLDVANPSDISFHSAKTEEPKTVTEIRRHEVWTKQYEMNPYLRHLLDEQVIVHGRQVFETLTPYFLKGAPCIPMEQLEPLLISWNDFLQEASHRGLDLRQMLGEV